jgi:hypothetical protein
MGWRFRKRWEILPGVHLNVGKRSASVSLGGTLGHITVGQHGARFGASIPGTGFYYVSDPFGTSHRRRRVSRRHPVKPDPRGALWRFLFG